MFDYLETNATKNEYKEGYGIGDYLLKVKPDEAILQQMMRKNPIKAHQHTTRLCATQGFTAQETRIQTLEYKV